MTSLVLLIPLSILILIGAGCALFWAIDHGQFEEMDSAAILPLFDADAPPTADPDARLRSDEAAASTRSSE